MIIIVIFTHREIQIGFVILLHYLICIIILRKVQNDVDAFMYCFLNPKCNNDYLFIFSLRLVNFKIKSVLLYVCE
jgi:hypothetical protein